MNHRMLFSAPQLLMHAYVEQHFEFQKLFSELRTAQKILSKHNQWFAKDVFRWQQMLYKKCGDLLWNLSVENCVAMLIPFPAFELNRKVSFDEEIKRERKKCFTHLHWLPSCFKPNAGRSVEWKKDAYTHIKNSIAPIALLV